MAKKKGDFARQRLDGKTKASENQGLNGFFGGLDGTTAPSAPWAQGGGVPNSEA